MIKLMGMENICILMELPTLEIGQMISRTDMEKKHGQMGQFMKGISKMVKNTEKAYFNGLTERLIMESLGTTTLKVMGFTCGQIKDDMRESGKTIKWKETVCSHGLMDDPTKVLTVMIRKKE